MAASFDEQRAALKICRDAGDISVVDYSLRLAENDKSGWCLSTCRSGVTRCHEVSPRCHRGVTKVSQKCHRGVTKVSRGVARCHEVSRRCHEVSRRCQGDTSVTRCHEVSQGVTEVSRGVTEVSPRCHRGVTEVSRGVTRCQVLSRSVIWVSERRHVDRH